MVHYGECGSGVYQKKISICLNRGRANSLRFDDVVALNDAKRPQFKQEIVEDDVKQRMPEGRRYRPPLG